MNLATYRPRPPHPINPTRTRSFAPITREADKAVRRNVLRCISGMVSKKRIRPSKRLNLRGKQDENFRRPLHGLPDVGGSARGSGQAAPSDTTNPADDDHGLSRSTR